jgi:hypothetical protein
MITRLLCPRSLVWTTRGKRIRQFSAYSVMLLMKRHCFLDSLKKRWLLFPLPDESRSKIAMALYLFPARYSRIGESSGARGGKRVIGSEVYP